MYYAARNIYSWDASTMDCVRRYPKSVFDDRNTYLGEIAEYMNNAA